jgi:hypothetical protein
VSHPIPKWLRDHFDAIELQATKLSGAGVFTQMRTKVQAYFMRFDDKPVAVVDEADDGMFIDIIHGNDGTPLKMGDKLYARGIGDSMSAQLADRDALLDLLKIKLTFTPQEYLVRMIDQALAASPSAEAQTYRLLTRADVIERTDEYLDDNAATWLPAGPCLFVGRQYNPGSMVPIRRPLRVSGGIQ